MRTNHGPHSSSSGGGMFGNLINHVATEEEIEEYEFQEDGEMEQLVQEAQDRDDPDDKSYPPESE